MAKPPKPPGKSWSKHPNTKPGKRAAQAAVAPRPAGLPTKAALVRFLAEAGEAEKADIARAFGLKGAERRALREMLRELEAEGALGRRGRKGFAPRGSLPPVGVVDVVERDADGELFVRLSKGEADAPLARLAPGRNEKAAGAPGMGDRLLVRFETGRRRLRSAHDQAAGPERAPDPGRDPQERARGAGRAGRPQAPRRHCCSPAPRRRS